MGARVGSEPTPRMGQVRRGVSVSPQPSTSVTCKVTSFLACHICEREQGLAWCFAGDAEAGFSTGSGWAGFLVGNTELASSPCDGVYPGAKKRWGSQDE